MKRSNGSVPPRSNWPKWPAEPKKITTTIWFPKPCSRRWKTSVPPKSKRLAPSRPVTAAIEKLRATIATGVTEDIKRDTEELQKAFYPIAEKLYAASGAGNPGEGDADGGAGDGAYYGSDFEDKTGN